MQIKSFPCHYTTLCPCKPHKPVHTHTHTHWNRAWTQSIWKVLSHEHVMVQFSTEFTDVMWSVNTTLKRTFCTYFIHKSTFFSITQTCEAFMCAVCCYLLNISCILTLQPDWPYLKPSCAVMLRTQQKNQIAQNWPHIVYHVTNISAAHAIVIFTVFYSA